MEARDGIASIPVGNPIPVPVPPTQNAEREHTETQPSRLGMTNTTLAGTRVKLAAPSARASAQEPRAEALIAWSATELAISALAWDPPEEVRGDNNPRITSVGDYHPRLIRVDAGGGEYG